MSREGKAALAKINEPVALSDLVEPKATVLSTPSEDLFLLGLVERHLFTVHREEVLSEEFAKATE